jgi:hypothetical protein
MSRGAHSLKQGDLTKAVRAVVEAGLNVQRVEIDREGKITVVPGEPLPPAPTGNEWDNIR